MHREHPVHATLCSALHERPPDPILSLIRQYHADPRPGKIDLGVGVYRDASGATPVLDVVREAERRLVDGQTSKAYLGTDGNIEFLRQLRPIVFGDADRGARCVALQTPGGSGALRLAAELAVRSSAGARIHVGDPTWPIHRSFFSCARLAVAPFEYFDVRKQRVRFESLCDVIRNAAPGDLMLLHACCHNPSGADLEPAQWQEVATLLASRGVVPLIDLAYQGLGDGLEQDAQGLRTVCAAVPEALVAYSCDKNFGMYRERVGALFVLTANAAEAQLAYSNLCDLARGNWSMPPDHGAAVVAMILGDPALRTAWLGELDAMRARLDDIRWRIAAQGRVGAIDLGAVARQKGLFSLLPLLPAQVDALRDVHGIYMTGGGRINVAGLRDGQVGDFVRALAVV